MLEAKFSDEPKWLWSRISLQSIKDKERKPREDNTNWNSKIDEPSKNFRNSKAIEKHLSDYLLNS